MATTTDETAETAAVNNSATGTSGAGPLGAAYAAQQKQRRDAEEQREREAAGSGTASSFSQMRALSAEQTRAKAAREAEQEEIDSDQQMTRKERKKMLADAKSLAGTFADYPNLDALRPREKYVFHSDYFRVDGAYATVLSFFHDDAANDGFGAFWGIDRITSGLHEAVTTVILEQSRRRSEKWVKSQSKLAERLDKLEGSEAEGEGSTREKRRRAKKVAGDMEVITDEIANGASYLNVHMRLLVKAPSLAILDDSVQKISELYIKRFATLKVAPYHGEQRQELTKLFAKNDDKRGKGFHFTSTELAGAHSLVTNGMNDATGEFVGHMVGDVNTSAVLLDVDAYDHHVVVGNNAVNPYLSRQYVSDMWGSKISQAAMLNNRRVVHIVLSGSDMDKLGPRFDRLTARLDMSSGDINMFEMFGKEEDELSIFSSHLRKLILMTLQVAELSEYENTAEFRGSLESVISQFYIDRNMWAENAPMNKELLRLVNLRHDDVPRLQDIVPYFQTKYTEMANKKQGKDESLLNIYSKLASIFKSMLQNNGDLFNTFTSSQIDAASDAQRVVYDFSKLIKRGKGVAMAQLVNTVGFAVDALDQGDVVVIHGTEHIEDPEVKKYIKTQLGHLHHRGGRVAYLYTDVKSMFDDHEFNLFDEADYTILGTMSQKQVNRYQEFVGDVPADLAKLVTEKGFWARGYIRRDHTNVVFQMDLPLGVAPGRAKRRAELMSRAEEIIGDTDLVESTRQSLEEVHDAQAAEDAAAAKRRSRRRMRRGPRRGPVKSAARPGSSGAGQPRMVKSQAQ